MKPALTTSDVDKILAAARKQAESNGWKVGIAVVDDGGYLVGALRLDGAGVVSVDAARMKARASALLRAPSATLAEVLKIAPALTALNDVMLSPGAVPILIDGEVVGGIGAGGALAEQDVEISSAGAAAVA